MASGGGGGGSSGSYFNSDAEIDKAAPCLNLKTSRTLKATFGHDGDNTFVRILRRGLNRLFSKPSNPPNH